jgi:fructose-specific phosphotransferase system IIC component
MSKEQSSESLMLRGALVPSFIVGIIAIIVSTICTGFSGFLGALIAQCVVIIYFAIHIGVSRIARNLDPMSTMALAVFSYFTKLLFLGLFLYLLSAFTSRETINRTSFGATAIALTFAWLGGEIASYMKLRIHLPLPESKNKF